MSKLLLKLQKSLISKAELCLACSVAMGKLLYLNKTVKLNISDTRIFHQELYLPPLAPTKGKTPLINQRKIRFLSRK